MKAAEDSVDSEAEPSEKDASRPKKKRQKIQVTDKKQKKNRVTPALLLMQKFSAQNLGKSRLTVGLCRVSCPSPCQLIICRYDQVRPLECSIRGRRLGK
jgi:hypothetical protein